MPASFEILKFDMNFQGASKTDAVQILWKTVILYLSTKEKYIYNVPLYEMFVIVRMQLLLPVFMDIHCNIDIVFLQTGFFFSFPGMI